MTAFYANDKHTHNHTACGCVCVGGCVCVLAAAWTLLLYALHSPLHTIFIGLFYDPFWYVLKENFTFIGLTSANNDIDIDKQVEEKQGYISWVQDVIIVEAVGSGIWWVKFWSMSCAIFGL